MVLCPDLETLDLDRPEWDALSAEEKINAVKNYVVAKWSGPYYRCAARHKALVEHRESF
jgi:hypothetical protein